MCFPWFFKEFCIITSNSKSIKYQTTSISNNSQGNIAKQSLDNSNLDFNVVRDIAFEVLIPLATTINNVKKVYENSYCNYCNTIQTPVQSNTTVNYSNTVSGKNASHPSQTSVKLKTSHMGKHNLFTVGNNHIEWVKKDLIICHLNDKNVSLNCKNFDGAEVRRMRHHLLPALHEGQFDIIIIFDDTSNISLSKFHTTWPHDLAIKIINIGNVCKSFGMARIAISSILPPKDLKHKKLTDEKKFFKGFTWFHLWIIVTLLKTNRSRRNTS